MVLNDTLANQVQMSAKDIPQNIVSRNFLQKVPLLLVIVLMAETLQACTFPEKLRRLCLLYGRMRTNSKCYQLILILFYELYSLSFFFFCVVATEDNEVV